MTHKAVLKRHNTTNALVLLFPELPTTRTFGVCRAFSGGKWTSEDWYAWMANNRSRPGTNQEWEDILPTLPQNLEYMECAATAIRQPNHTKREDARNATRQTRTPR